MAGKIAVTYRKFLADLTFSSRTFLTAGASYTHNFGRLDSFELVSGYLISRLYLLHCGGFVVYVANGDLGITGQTLQAPFAHHLAIYRT